MDMTERETFSDQLSQWIKLNVKDYEKLGDNKILTTCPKCNAHLEVHSYSFECYGYNGCKSWKCPQKCYNTCRKTGATINELIELYDNG